METDDFDSKTAAFLQWLATEGIVLSPKVALVDLRSAGRGRGLAALADIAEDEVLFTIPRSAVLKSSTVSNSDIQDMPPWLALTATILVEGSRPDSKWAPYLALLPQALDSLAFWSEEELLELQASAVVKKIGKEAAEQKFVEYISPLGLSNGTMEMCHRVASIIMAYAFDIPEKGSQDGPEELDNEGDDLVSDDEEDEKTILTMVPLADLLNADADRNNARLCCDNEDLEMRCIKPILSGDEIFNDYGQLPRSDLLRRYGYITENYTSHDVVELSTQSLLSSLSTQTELSLSPLSVEDVERRIELAQREGVYEESYDLCHPSPDGPSIPDELVALLYLLLLDGENLTAIESSQTALPSRSKMTTSLVGLFLVKAIGRRADEYATTADQDQSILQASNLPPRKAMAIQVRLGEKMVLRKAVEEATSFTASDKRMRLKDGGPDEVPRGANGKRKATEEGQGSKKGRYKR